MEVAYWAYDGYKYHKNRESVDKMYWRCTSQSCLTYIHTQFFLLDAPPPVIQIVKEAGTHNHPPDDDSIIRSNLLHEMKEAITRDPCAPTRKAYDAVLDIIEISDDDMPTYHSVQQVLKRKRSSCLPPYRLILTM